MEFIDPPDGRPWGLIGIAGASILLNVILAGALLWPSGDAPTDGSTVAAAEQAAPLAAPPGESAVASGVTTEVDAEGVVTNIAEGEDAAGMAPVVVPAGVQVASAPVERNLAYTFHKAVGDGSDALSATTARLFVWDLDLRRDLQRGDRVDVAWTMVDDLPQIEAARMHSQKLGDTLTAYRFQATGDAYASYWSKDGTEVPQRLKQTPLPGGYEQVTSLLKDRPTHAGMDFKVPVGEDVVTPRAGTVVRTDWNWSNNGNCVEVKWADGTLAKFLHLSETGVKPGQSLKAGARIGASGNTGHSTAPHLHYELEKGGRTLDPIDVHGTTRRSLPAADMARFAEEVARKDALLDAKAEI
mgnify:CR=1 FL=1